MTPAYVAAGQRSGDLVLRGRGELDAWLSVPGEPALEPGLPIVDAHHHLWERPGDDYGIDAFQAEILASGHDVRASVFVECRWRYDVAAGEALAPVGETRHVARLASAATASTSTGAATTGAAGTARRAGEIAAAIVGFADLTLGDAVEPVLAAHVAAGGGRFRGVRHRAVFDPHVRPNTPGLRPGLLGDAAFRRGFAVLQRMGLVFDAWQYYHQLDEVADLARAFPQATIIVGHTGGPLGVGPHAADPAGTMARWRAGIDAIARCDNVLIKLGGLGMLHCGFDFQYGASPPGSQSVAAAWRPWLAHCIERFGTRRCMFESNFPVDRQSCGYGVLWNAFKRVAAGCSTEEKRELFEGTARRAYGIRVNK